MNKNNKNKILHIFPGSSAKRYIYSGGSKGINIFNNFFDSENILKNDLVVNKKSDFALLKKLLTYDLSNYSHALIHYPMFPLSAIYIKFKNPKVKIIIRSHNAEFPHWLQHAYLELRGFRLKRSLSCFFTSIRNGYGEIILGILANHILAITEWEQNVYWRRRVTSPNKILYAPYFIDVTNKDLPQNDRKNLCICLMSPNHSSFLEDAAKNFYSAVSRLDNHENWFFAITGDGYKHSHDNNNIEELGFVDNIKNLLRTASAIAVLTEYGYGFKTKVLEAAAEGCWSIVPENTIPLIPKNIRPFCIPVNIKSSESFIEALNQAQGPLPSFENQNNKLKSHFIKALNNSLQIEEVR
jgi:glycosyltransferase involved in cell wall biosynthesis